MSHPFEVGKTFRNRSGEYVVVSIDGEQMKIKYVSGGTLVTDVNMQARIWENIQFEEQMSRAEERRRLAVEARLEARMRTKRAKAEPKFGGFQETDFEPKKRGISWLSRRDLGRVLAYGLNRGAAAPFVPFPVPRLSAVHVARKERYNTEVPVRNAAFFVTAGEHEVSYGLYVGKPDGPAEAGGPWATILAALAHGAKVRDALRTTMAQQQLTLEVYAMRVSFGLVGRVTVQESGFLWQEESAQHEMARPMDWGELVEALRTLSAEKRCELHIGAQMPKEEALKAGAEVAAPMATVLAALLPAYNAAVGP